MLVESGFTLSGLYYSAAPRSRSLRRWTRHLILLLLVNTFQTASGLPLLWKSIVDGTAEAANATTWDSQYGDQEARYFDLTVGRTYLAYNPFVPTITIPTYFFFSSKL